MISIKRNIDLVFILLIGFLLRFTISFTHSYSNDELSAVTRLSYSNFNDLITEGVQNGDMHPAGVQVFMKGWSLLFGTSEIAMRFPFVLFGTVSIFILFLIGKQWFNRKVGIFAAGLLSVLYFPILNSEFARPYSPGLWIALCVGLYFYKVLFGPKDKIKNSILLGVFFAAGMYTHYFAFLFIGFVGITGLLFLNKENWKYYIGSGILGVLFFLPHIGVTNYHLGVGGLQWLAPPPANWLMQFLFHAFNTSWFVILPLFFLLVFSLFQKGKKMPFVPRNVWILILWFFGIYLLGHLLSYVSTPVLKFPVMLFAFPYFLLLIALLFSKLPKFNLVLGGVMLLCIGSTVVEKELYQNVHFAPFKEVGINIAQWNNTYGEENIYTIYNLNNPDYMNYYAEEWQGDAIDFDWHALEFASDIPLRSDLLNRREEYCVIGYSSRITLVQIFETVREFYPKVIAYARYNNGAVYLMKKGLEETPARKEIEITSFPSQDNKGNWTFNTKQLTLDTLGHPIYELDKNHIYGPTYVFHKRELPIMENGYLKVTVKADLQAGDQLTVAMSGERKGEVIQFRDENMWIGHDLEEMILTTKSQTGYFAFKIPPYILADDLLKISLWNRSGTKIEIRDFRVDLIENIWN